MSASPTSSNLTWRRYDEVVEQIHGKGKYTILLRQHPLYLQGYGPVRHQARYRNSVLAPKVPLYNGGLGLGATSNPVSTAVASGGAVGAALIGANAGAISSAIGISAAAVPVIGAAVAAVAAIFAGLWSAHEQRLQEAKSENQAVNNGVAGVDQAIKTINSAYNSGQATAAQCIQALQQVEANFWSEVAGVIQPGRNACDASPSGSANCSAVNATTACSGSSGAACCVGCSDLFSTGPQPAEVSPYGSVYYGIAGAILVLQQGSGTSVMQSISASKYGVTSRAAYQLTWNPPAVASTSSSATSGDVSSAIDELTGGLTTAVSDAETGNFSGLLLLGAAALAAYLIF